MQENKKKFEVGDKIKIVSEHYGESYKGLVIEVVPEGKCTSAKEGVWIDKRTAEVNWVNETWNLDDFELVYRKVDQDKPKRFTLGDKVISTKNTPSVPEGYVGFVVENDQSNYEYAVKCGFGMGTVEYFNEDELELLSASKTMSDFIVSTKLEPSLFADKEEHTGGSVDYYKVFVSNPTTLEQPYYAEANDIIESLGLTFAEGNLLKAVWRIAADRNGKKKKGNNSVYDAEKLVFFAERILSREKAK